MPKKRYSTTTTQEELPALFRAIADALEGKGPEYLPVIEQPCKLKLQIRDDFGDVVVKLKLDEAACRDADIACSCPDCTAPIKDDGRPRYKYLKKRMQSSFKSIFRAVHGGILPVPSAMESFITDSRLMTQYIGYGDAEYARYDEAVDTLQQAWNAQDVQALHAAVDHLAHLKAECHHQYK